MSTWIQTGQLIETVCFFSVAELGKQWKYAWKLEGKKERRLIYKRNERYKDKLKGRAIKRLEYEIETNGMWLEHYRKWFWKGVSMNLSGIFVSYVQFQRIVWKVVFPEESHIDHPLERCEKVWQHRYSEIL